MSDSESSVASACPFVAEEEVAEVAAPIVKIASKRVLKKAVAKPVAVAEPVAEAPVEEAPVEEAVAKPVVKAGDKVLTAPKRVGRNVLIDGDAYDAIMAELEALRIEKKKIDERKAKKKAIDDRWRKEVKEGKRVPGAGKGGAVKLSADDILALKKVAEKERASAEASKVKATAPVEEEEEMLEEDDE
jgi:hypothetical protein